MSRPVLTAAERQIGTTALVVLLIGLLVAATTSPGTLDRSAVLAGAEVPEHRIVDLETRADGRVLTAHVVVAGTPDADALVTVVAALVDELRDEHEYSGLRLKLYDHEGYLEIGATLGQAIDAPEGEWTRAVRSTSDYRLHRTVVTVRDKDWDQRPSQRHMETVLTWQRQQGDGRSADGEGATAPSGAQAGEPPAGEPDDPQTARALEEVYAWSVSGDTVEVVLE